MLLLPHQELDLAHDTLLWNGDKNGNSPKAEGARQLAESTMSYDDRGNQGHSGSLEEENLIFGAITHFKK